MPDTSLAGLIDRDRGLLWHPYAPLNGVAPYAVESASGVRLSLRDNNGRSYEAIDAMSSWWRMVHGYRNPVLDRAILAQLAEFSHVMFGGLTHEPAVELAEKLRQMSPEPLQHVFFADSGSVSVEVSLKLALQYQSAQGLPDRQKFLALRGGYHGDTFAAMGVSDPDGSLHTEFPGELAANVFAPRPPAATLHHSQLSADPDELSAWAAEVTELVYRNAHQLAGIIVEPVLQGAGGMFVYDPQCLQLLRELADSTGLLLIFDEIATGFGRTGTLFAAEWAGVLPDVLCLGKALTGGYLSLAATLCSAEIASVLGRSELGALMHGPTFMANPLACAAANASLDLLATKDWQTQVAKIDAQLTSGLVGALELTSVQQIRTLGAVGVLELNVPVDVPAVTRVGLENGVWLRPFRNLVYTMPPYVSSAEDTVQITQAMVAAVAEVHG
ncbi:sdenosylmethionine-8-amino-7-oxononanoate aminotransferase [Renibacterium salmoninarum ATCC 33209]|uniref:Adenosylmethionine-8-amino-7-oxononanoate aminotransferase n=1 Tax=Renibacterium salmoninarum (strain ATCC 33209 / DSM 20767 / JCM 11484 / NBRC 15589 / NCIMB 2235) TaxID=288705 RepID=A9WL38_RENSM|nr:adenosylmethionine--8-amino-7-oxononanoate transaminase [Renibacterium salmoninarum]ABY22307.1 sdenosylmethionine-8-amino-7-oxononanoate aminotransferase [Renibacterium salmoninarum ATCC 33209]